ncbi:MAG: cytochrome C, partial [Gammaproteobacteria bacterium]
SNQVMCYRGHHTNKTIGQDNHDVWCTDCHGDLNQRIAEGQLANPWSEATLPMCQDCHSATGENGTLQHTFGGSFLKSMSHKNDAILCSTCHGSPHALNPSTLAKDNAQNLALQGLPNPIGKCSTCHTNKKDSYSKPAH